MVLIQGALGLIAAVLPACSIPVNCTLEGAHLHAVTGYMLMVGVAEKWEHWLVSRGLSLASRCILELMCCKSEGMMRPTAFN